MKDIQKTKTAIIDYNMGNLFSVQHACLKVGILAEITSDKKFIQEADALILPGVGAFGDAMDTLKKLDIIQLLKDKINEGTPFLGICLGMQLLMSESNEFGTHQGLDLIPGKVVRFELPKNNEGKILKVPEVQWNKIKKPSADFSWKNSLLENIPDLSYFYFVHSYYCVPDNKKNILSLTQYGNHDYCSTLNSDNIFACQYHPERSGPLGLKMYEKFKEKIISTN